MSNVKTSRLEKDVSKSFKVKKTSKMFLVECIVVLNKESSKKNPNIYKTTLE